MTIDICFRNSNRIVSRWYNIWNIYYELDERELLKFSLHY